MLLVKLRNGLELTWESLDSQERQLVLYALAYLAVTVICALAKKASDGRVEQIRREIREELARGDTARA